MSTGPRSLVDLCLYMIDDPEQIQYLTRFEKIHARMFHVLDKSKQISTLGETRTWYDNGQLHTQAYYVDGKRHGDHRGWYISGALRSIWPYVHGERHGVQIIWYESGQMQSKTHSWYGKRHGSWQIWHPDGSPKDYCDFYDGKKH